MKTIRVMVVEDGKGFCKDICSALSDDRLHPSIAFEVIKEVESGKEAIRYLELSEPREWPDVIVMDIQFSKEPRPNGISATKTITATYPTIKVLICSQYDDLEFVKRAFLNRASGYFLKNGEEPVSNFRDFIYRVWRGEYFVTQRIMAQMVTLLTGDSTGVTPREWEVVHLHIQGYSHKEIGDRLDMSDRTVESHLGKVRKKWNVKTFEELKKKFDELQGMRDPGGSA